MFEANLSSTALEEPADGDALRIPGWEEIVAQLAAARDLRIALRHPGMSGRGSFSQLSAMGVAGVNGETCSVNPTGLARGKTQQAKNVDAANHATVADREIQ